MIKKNDIAMLILVVGIVFVITLFLAGSVIKSPESRAESVTQVNQISSEFPPVDKRIFNGDSINPTQEIEITGSDSKQPFLENEE